MLEIRNRFGQSRDCLCGLCYVCVLNCGLGVVRPGNGHGLSVPQSGTDAW